MRHILSLCVLLLYGTFSAWAQEATDSIRIEGGLSAKEIEELTTPMQPTEGTLQMEPIYEGLTPSQASDIDIDLLTPLEKRYTEVPDLQIQVMPKGSYLPYWKNGFMYGSNSQSSSLMYGYVAHSNIGIYQQLGKRWSMNAGVTLSKYSIYYNTATISGSLTWQANRYMDITAFGSYMPGSFFSPIQLGPSFNWGGYLDLHTDTDIPFGVDLGASTYYDPIFGHQTTPIVQPYIKVGGSKIGFDFGPMIRDALQRSNRDHNNGTGVIPKPIKAYPQVAPR